MSVSQVAGLCAQGGSGSRPQEPARAARAHHKDRCGIPELFPAH
jgi:hypothetical protein